MDNELRLAITLASQIARAGDLTRERDEARRELVAFREHVTLSHGANVLAFVKMRARAEAAEAELARLRAGAVPEGQWQDIASAPKDGTPILLWAEDADLDAYYDHPRWGELAPRCPAVPYVGFWADNYWQLAHNKAYGWEATHWLPLLPSPPQPDTGEGAGSVRDAGGAS